MLRRWLYWGGLALLSGVAVFVAANGLMVSGEQQYMYARVEDVPPHKVAIVLGASVLRSGQLSPVFLDRADAAIALYKAGKTEKILVSGDNGTVEHNEVDPAKKYLISQGIPEGDIYLDHAGFDTYSTMYRARAVFGVKDAIVTTQSYHLSRSLFLAHQEGIEAVGYRADDADTHLALRNEVRESLARIKALLDVAIHRVPKYLGDPVSIL